MNTYTHLLMTAALGEHLKQRRMAVCTRSVLLGSVLPDVPLILLTMGYIIYHRYIVPLPPGEHIFSNRYDQLYFANPFWIVSHSFLHAPFMIAMFALLGYYGLRSEKKWGGSLLWFAFGCGLHSLVDIFTHHNDGPLLLFPFNWTYRFITPISYWDSNHYGDIVGTLEHLLDLAILVFFAILWLRRLFSSKRRPVGEGPGL